LKAAEATNTLTTTTYVDAAASILICLEDTVRDVPLIIPLVALTAVIMLFRLGNAIVVNLQTQQDQLIMPTAHLTV
jgi:hypothetical protein